MVVSGNDAGAVVAETAGEAGVGAAVTWTAVGSGDGAAVAGTAVCAGTGAPGREGTASIVCDPFRDV